MRAALAPVEAGAADRAARFLQCRIVDAQCLDPALARRRQREKENGSECLNRREHDDLQVPSAGKPGRMEKIDDLTLRISFDEPHGNFMEQLASQSHLMAQSPRHFLEKYHPTRGDPAFIRSEMRAFRMPGPRAEAGERKPLVEPPGHLGRAHRAQARPLPTEPGGHARTGLAPAGAIHSNCRHIKALS